MRLVPSLRVSGRQVAFVQQRSWHQRQLLFERRRHYSLLRIFSKKPPETKNDSHLPWEERDNSAFMGRVVIAMILMAGMSTYGMYKMAGPDSPVAEEVGLVLGPYKWTEVMVVATEDVTPNSKLITLAVPRPRHPRITDKYRPIWSLYVKDDDIMVERPYTPLTGFDQGGRMQIWVKKYEHGEVSRWLHNKAKGDTLDIRAPVRTWQPDEDVDELVMISGGTGVTPFFQLFSLYIKNPNLMPKTKFTLLHSARTPEELLPPFQLDQLTEFATQNPERFKLKLFVESDPRKFRDKNPDLDVSIGRIRREDIQTVLPPPLPWYRNWWSSETAPDPRRTFLVCGPQPMISTIAGPYGRNFSQGTLGGYLKELGFQSKDVVKL